MVYLFRLLLKEHRLRVVAGLLNANDPTPPVGLDGPLLLLGSTGLLFDSFILSLEAPLILKVAHLLLGGP